MPLNISRSDRKLLFWAAGIFLPIIIALALLSNREEDSGIPSTYSAQSSGAKAAYLLLHDLGYRAERWEQSPADLPADAKGTVLVLAGPTTTPTREEQDALRLYLARGGRILATGATAGVFLPDAQTTPNPLPPPIPQVFEPQIVSPLTRSGRIRLSPAAHWKEDTTAYLAHYSDQGRPVVVSYFSGAGEVIWWAANRPLSNAGISSDGNLALLLNSLGAPAETRVFWDEYFHSSRRTVGSYIFERPVFFGLAQLALLALAMLVTYSRRNGPIYPSDEPSRLSPLEFVETIGGLYRRAHAVRAALEVPYNRFRTLAIRQLGLKPDVSATELARALRKRLGYKDEKLEDLVQRIEAALYDPELTESTALELVQELNSHSRQLGFTTVARQETPLHASSLASADSRKN